MKFSKHRFPKLTDSERLAEEIRAQGSAADVATASIRAQYPVPRPPKRPSRD